MINFEQAANRLLPHAETILSIHCPGGKRRGHEYVASSITGGEGTSFSLNLTTGRWADFATGEKGKDIISYYAHLKSINNAQALDELSAQYLSGLPQVTHPIKPQKPAPRPVKPPINSKFPNPNYKGHSSSAVYVYRDESSEPLFYICRYDYDGKKHFTPYTFSENGEWTPKHWPNPRPLFNLDKLLHDTKKPVLIVEGEKAALAAEKFINIYTVVTWSSGANSIKNTDFTPLTNRSVLLWPDADEPGIKAMSILASILKPICQQVKVINTDQANGWDAADALSEGFNQSKFLSWAKPLVIDLNKSQANKSQAPIQTLVDEPPPEIQIVERENEPPRNKSVLFIELGLTPISEKNPMPIPNMANVSKLLNYVPQYKDKIWVDEFHQAILTTYNCTNPRKWNNYDDVILTYDFQSNWNMPKLSSKTIEEAVRNVGISNRKNELKEWLLSLKWDGEPRIETFLTNAYGVEQTDYVKAVSRNWLIGLVARGISPGCKFDEMLILEGPQGTFKSTSIRALAGKYFSESNASLDSKDFMQELTGVWIVEFDELDQFRKSDATLIKKKLSQQTDRYRPSHMPHVVDVPRTCVFVGTTNQSEYLKDETGGRRFWPIRIEKADIEYIKENREQLFAEAAHLFKNGATWHEMPESTKDEQEARRQVEGWEPFIEEYLCRTEGVLFDNNLNPNEIPLTCENIAVYILGIEKSRYGSSDKYRISKAMRALGYKTFSKTVENRRIKVYLK